MEIRQATFEDMKGLLDLGETAFEESPYYKRFTQDFARQYKVIVACLQDPGTAIFVCDDFSGVLIGHITQQPWFVEPIAENDLFYIKPEVRGSSRALRLLEAFEAWAVGKGVRHYSVSVSSGIQTDKTAGFLEKLGFEPNGLMFVKEL